jgi:hypothetical protein
MTSPPLAHSGTGIGEDINDKDAINPSAGDIRELRTLCTEIVECCDQLDQPSSQNPPSISEIEEYKKHNIPKISLRKSRAKLSKLLEHFRTRFSLLFDTSRGLSRVSKSLASACLSRPGAGSQFNPPTPNVIVFNNELQQLQRNSRRQYTPERRREVHETRKHGACANCKKARKRVGSYSRCTPFMLC